MSKVGSIPGSFKDFPSCPSSFLPQPKEHLSGDLSTIVPLRMIGMSQFQTFPYIPSSASGNLVMPAALFYCHFFGPPGILLGKEIRKAHKSCFLHVTTVAPWETITYQFPWYTLKVTQHGHLFFVERAACHPVSHSLDFLGLCHLQVLSLSSSLSTQRGNYLLSLSVCVCKWLESS